MAEGLSKALTFYEKGKHRPEEEGPWWWRHKAKAAAAVAEAVASVRATRKAARAKAQAPLPITSSAPDTAGPAPADMAGAESSGGDDMAERLILARRTAVRALLAQAGSLKQLGRLPEALEAALRAVDFDESVRRVHVAPLEAEIAAARTQP